MLSERLASDPILMAVQTAQQGYGTTAQQGYGTTAQQGYGSTVQSSQGYGSSSYGTPQQGATAAYGQQQQAPQTQPTPTPFTAQAGYQASQGSVPSSGAYGPQTAAAYGTQATVTPQGYGSQISQAPYAMQQAAYGQQAPRTSMAAAQPGAMQQPAYGQQATAKSSYQASYGGQVTPCCKGFLATSAFLSMAWRGTGGSVWGTSKWTIGLHVRGRVIRAS